MAMHKLVSKPGIYFITFTCHDWLPLIELTEDYNLVYNWFDVLSAKRHIVTGYVIMPNHIHLLLYYAGGEKSLNSIIGNGKRFMAYDIVKSLREKGQEQMLLRLNLAVNGKDKDRGKKHEIWKTSFDVKECRTEKFILQKLHYIHNNPCTGKWKLAADPTKYVHSSASFYISGRHSRYTVRDYLDFLSPDED